MTLDELEKYIGSERLVRAIDVCPRSTNHERTCVGNIESMAG